MTATSAIAAGLWLALAVRAVAQPDSLDLRTALTLARSHSPEAAAAASGVGEARGREAAADSYRYPRFSANALYLRYQDPPSVPFGPLGTFAPFAQNTYVIQFLATQPLYSGGRVAAGIQASRWGRKAAVLSAEQSDVELTAAVARAYDDALLARAEVEVAQQSEFVLEAALRVAEEHYRAGTVSRLDVLRAETKVSSARAALRASQDAAVTTRVWLAAQIGLEDTTPPVAGALEDIDLYVDGEALLARARSARPDVAALRAGAEAARAQADYARAALRPTVALFATTLGTRPELVSGRERFSWDVLGGVSVSWPVFDFGAASGEARAAEAVAERRKSQARGATDAAVAATQARLRELDRAAQDIAAARADVARADRALEIAQERYDEGEGTQLDVFEAEADLTGARGAVLRAIHARREAAIELRRLTGLAADAPLPSRSEGGAP